MAFRPQVYRLKRIVELIRTGMAEGRAPNCSDFCRELSLSRPTVMRYLAWLKDDEGAPIEFVQEKNGYRMKDRTWSLKAPDMTRAELTSLLMARKLAKVFQGTPWEREMHRALGKVASAFEGRVDGEMLALADRFTVVEEDYAPQNPEVWLAVGRQTVKGERMRVEYERFDGKRGTYELDPLHLYAYHGNWYVLAKKTSDGSVGMFAISRMRRVENRGEPVRRPDGLDPEEYMHEAFGIVRGGKLFKVRLVFSPAVAAYIRERVWHCGQRMRTRRDGWLEVSFETAGWKELVRWVLSWQPDCRVLAPKRLRERIAEKLRDGLRAYE